MSAEEWIVVIVLGVLGVLILAAFPTGAILACMALEGEPPWGRKRRWRKEDEAFARYAAYVLDASRRGVDTSWLDDCPDITRLNLP